MGGGGVCKTRKNGDQKKKKKKSWGVIDLRIVSSLFDIIGGTVDGILVWTRKKYSHFVFEIKKNEMENGKRKMSEMESEISIEIKEKPTGHQN